VPLRDLVVNFDNNFDTISGSIPEPVSFTLTRTWFPRVLHSLMSTSSSPSFFPTAVASANSCFFIAFCSSGNDLFNFSSSCGVPISLSSGPIACYLGYIDMIGTFSTSGI
jgi:hypothetical protein